MLSRTGSSGLRRLPQNEGNRNMFYRFMISKGNMKLYILFRTQTKMSPFKHYHTLL